MIVVVENAVVGFDADDGLLLVCFDTDIYHMLWRRAIMTRKQLAFCTSERSEGPSRTYQWIQELFLLFLFV